jgi:pilus assembly protein CpaD
MSSTKIRAFVVLGLAGALAAGCAGGAGRLAREGGTNQPETPTEQYKPKVSVEPEDLALAPHPEGLSDNQRQALAVFAARYRDDAPVEITLRVPQGGADAVTPGRMVTQVMQALEWLGISRNSVRVAGYDGATDPASPVVLSYQRYKPDLPDCSRTWNNIGATMNNRPSTNFGCASTANLAAMVADPRDLMRPAETDPADPVRRATVIDLYRKGELTSTKRDEQASGAVSKKVQ